VRRRDLFAVVAGAAVAWPLALRAQQKAMPVIGYLSGASPAHMPRLWLRSTRD
jgi:hypothetical protein